MQKDTYKLRSTGRQVFPMPWKANTSCPWNKDTHMRVVIPFSEVELRNSSKFNHIQIVRKSRLIVS